MSDDEQQEIYDRYENEGGEDAYFGCSDIDHLFDKWVRRPMAFRARRLEDERVEEGTSYDETLDGVREWCQGNSPL
mgnify:FL=1